MTHRSPRWTPASTNRKTTNASPTWAIHIAILFLCVSAFALPAWSQCGDDPGNDDFAHATPYEGFLIFPDIDCPGDLDMYEFIAWSPGNYKFEFFSNSSIVWTFYNASHVQQGAYSNTQAKVFTLAENEHLFIAVKGYDVWDTGEYLLGLRGMPCDPPTGDPGDDTFDTATVLSSCGSTRTAIHCDDDLDFYRFTAPSSGAYTFNVLTEHHYYLTLYDANRNVISQTSDSPLSKTMVANEVVFLRMARHENATGFMYTLEIAGCSGGDCGDDPGNNDTASATDLGSQCGITSAQIDCEGDYDYYRFTAPSSGSYNMYTAGGTDTYLTLSDHNGTPLTWDDDSAQDTNASVVYTLTQGSTYFIAVNEFGDNATGSYHLYISGCQTGCGDDPDNDEIGTATSMPSCGTTQARIDCATDADWYVFQAPANATYTWSITPTNTAGMLLVASDGTSEIDAGQNSVSATIIQGDFVYLDVSASDGTSIFNYTLTLSGCPSGGCGDDPGNNDTASATDIGNQCGTTAGRIDCMGDQDFYQFFAPKSGLFIFETTGSTNTYLRLYLDNGGFLTQDDNSGDGDNARMEWGLISGRTYYIAVHVYDNDETGDYDLIVSGCSGGDCGDDPGNDDFNTATDLGSQCGTQSARIDCLQDMDVYRFAAPSSGGFDIYTTGNVDTVVTLYDDNRTVLILDNDSGQGTNGSIHSSLDQGSTYFISVTNFAGSGTGPYDLVVSGCQGGGCGDDPGDDDIASATDLGTQCGSTQAAFDCTGDVDVYRFTPPVTADFTIETTGSSDTLMSLKDHQGAVITSDDDSGTDHNARIVHNLIQGTTYFVEISEYNNDDTGDYTLVISGCSGGGCGDDPGNDSMNTATNLGSSCGSTQAAIDCSGDEDFYYFTTPNAGLFSFAAGAGAADLDLMDPTGTVVDSDTFSVETNLAQGQTIYLRISSFAMGNTFNYTLTIGGCSSSGCGNDPGNDDIASATDLGTQCGSTQAAFDCTGDVDVYRFTSPVTADFTIETTGPSDTLILLTDHQGAVFASDDDSGTNQNARIVHNLVQGTAYFIEIREYHNDDTGDYTLNIAGCDGPVPIDFNYIVTTVAKLAGASGTNWASDLVVLNTGQAAALVTVSMWKRDQANPNPAEASITLTSGALWKQPDVLLNLFGITSGAATLHIHSDQPLAIASRTFNDTGAGTYGQFIAGVAEETAVQLWETAVLADLRENNDFRTNLGLVNPTSAQITVVGTFFDSDGASLGARNFTVPAFGYVQFNHVLTPQVTGAATGVWMTLTSADGPFFPFSSVVDNYSGDPVYKPGRVPSSVAEDLLLSGLAKLQGEAGTNWLSDVTILNPGSTDQSVNCALWERDADNSSAALRTIEVKAGDLVNLNDVMANLFGHQEGAAALVLPDVNGLIADCRTYNQVATGSFGQYIPSMTLGQAVFSDRIGHLVMIAETAQARTNLGLVNIQNTPADIELRLFDASGAQIGQTKTINLPASGVKQINRIVRQFTGQNIAAASLELRIAPSTPLGWVHAYASVVDQITGDPIFETVNVSEVTVD